jgi:hypothetical protein
MGSEPQGERAQIMAVVLLEYRRAVVTGTGRAFAARACGAPAADGTRRWHGWFEFMPGGDRASLRTPRETTQPNRAATLYWATGITPVYLEGALRRCGTVDCLPRRTPATETQPYSVRQDSPPFDKTPPLLIARTDTTYARMIGRLVRARSPWYDA